METRLKSYSSEISTLATSGDPMAQTKVSVLQYKSHTLR